MRYRLSGIDLHPEQNFSPIRSALSEEIRREQTDVHDILPLPAGAVAAQTTGVGGPKRARNSLREQRAGSRGRASVGGLGDEVKAGSKTIVFNVLSL